MPTHRTPLGPPRNRTIFFALTLLCAAATCTIFLPELFTHPSTHNQNRKIEQPVLATRSLPRSLSAGPRLVENYGRLPLAFEANAGQTDGRVQFLSRGHGYTMFLTGNEAVLSLRAEGQKANGKWQKRPTWRGPSDPR